MYTLQLGERVSINHIADITVVYYVANISILCQAARHIKTGETPNRTTQSIYGGKNSIGLAWLGCETNGFEWVFLWRPYKIV